MATQIDHIVIAVRDLDAASRDYAGAGFQVVPGGEHTGGATHNALVTFNDGSYFELIAFKNNDQAPDPPHRWWEKLAKGEGLVDYAVLSEDLAQEAAEIQDRGAEIDGPHDGRGLPLQTLDHGPTAEREMDLQTVDDHERRGFLRFGHRSSAYTSPAK